MQALLYQAVDADKPVIPVLLPSSPKKPKLPPFLFNRTWVDFRGGYTEAGLDRLIWGVTGKKPDSLSMVDETTQKLPTTPPLSSGQKAQPALTTATINSAKSVTEVKYPKAKRARPCGTR